ncbi:hypothetical protein [Aporhodopirellula aestuarii]|uniref:Membrane transport protein MMPL domain-containing protein n=1 Tax=Aporhodopirellula aestuarii TaxID=2950107 RepID=A0ABT0UDR8_9BACT|nr:hypothetical protein [Aporhodopirellula aestuarii]MCM2374874.1 hypothetical protein [Aporhodopirellula aestuarii]
MSRLIGSGFLLFDATATLAASLASPSLFATLGISLVSSIAIALASASLRSVLFPTYFWDKPETLDGR